MCIDQIEFMVSLLEPNKLLNRIERYTQEEIQARRLLKGSFSLLKEAFLRGEFTRGQAASITHYQERQARTVLNDLIKKGLLVSESHRASLRLGIPMVILNVRSITIVYY